MLNWSPNSFTFWKAFIVKHLNSIVYLDVMKEQQSRLYFIH